MTSLRPEIACVVGFPDVRTLKRVDHPCSSIDQGKQFNPKLLASLLEAVSPEYPSAHARAHMANLGASSGAEASSEAEAPPPLTREVRRRAVQHSRGKACMRVLSIPLISERVTYTIYPIQFIFHLQNVRKIQREWLTSRTIQPAKGVITIGYMKSDTCNSFTCT